MPKSGTFGSVRGAPSNGRPYRDPLFGLSSESVEMDDSNLAAIGWGPVIRVVIDRVGSLPPPRRAFICCLKRIIDVERVDRTPHEARDAFDRLARSAGGVWSREVRFYFVRIQEKCYPGQWCGGTDLLEGAKLCCERTSRLQAFACPIGTVQGHAATKQQVVVPRKETCAVRVDVFRCEHIGSVGNAMSNVLHEGRPVIQGQVSILFA